VPRKKEGNDTNLREKAERKLGLELQRPEEELAEDAQRLIHELRVHQIELEMQNEELRNVQAELEESRAGYADLFDFSPVGYVSIDKDGLIHEVNLTLARLLGIERGQLIGKPFMLNVAPADRDLLYLHCGGGFKTGGRAVCELRLKKKGGEEFYAQLESIFVKDAEGASSCRTAIMDVSERKRVEKELGIYRDNLEKLVEERTLELARTNELLIQEIAERINAGQKLEEQAGELEEINTALKVLLKLREEEQKELGRNIQSNLTELVLPYLDKLKKGRLDHIQRSYVEILGSAIHEVLSPFLKNLFSAELANNLSPTEIQVANLIKEGKTSKEIAQLLCIAEKTVSSHRYQIRKKLGLINEKINLQTHLRSLK